MQNISQDATKEIINEIQECCHEIYPSLDSFAGMLFGNNKVETDTARDHLKSLAKTAIRLGYLLEIYFATATNYNEETKAMLMNTVSKMPSGIWDTLKMIKGSEMSFDYGILLLDISFLYKLAIQFV